MISRLREMYSITSESMITDLPDRLWAVVPAEGVEITLMALEAANPFIEFEVSELVIHKPWKAKAVGA